MLWALVGWGSRDLQAASSDPASSEYSGRKGVTLYVSKLGDNSTGRSWETGFRTVQAALDAIPDADGGHRVVVRPDTYMEANLFVQHPGAAGAYNLLVGDVDGRLGSGTTGQVVLDSGDPSKGFKSYDWWGNIKSYSKGWSAEHKDATFSAICWDRWILRGLYATGGDGGLFFDCTDRVEPFTVIVEDCVSIGRAFGGGVASCLSRVEEPITYRRCKLWALDWWGDTAGAYVRVENKAMPDKPDVVFENCTMVSPQCALKGGNFGFHTFMRIKVVGCSLVTLNFSQPAGTPIDGIIQSVELGKYLHVDLEDSTLMGYKVFGVRVNKETSKDIGFSTKGAVQAYVQHTQEVPKGMLRLGHWPAGVFANIVPEVSANIPRPQPVPDGVSRSMCEVSPFVWKDRLCLLECVRPATGGTREDYWLKLTDVESGKELAHFGTGYSLAAAFAHKGRLYVSASRFEKDNWNDVTLFQSTDLKTWTQDVIVTQQPNEHLFNSSVCAGPKGFVLAYESNDPAYPAFTVKFAQSKDLKAWKPVPHAVFGTDRYAACPTIRYANGYFYVLYLEHRTPRWFFETYIARSRDLVSWFQSPLNPVLTPGGLDEGINASDPDITEFKGRTYLYYAVGDQLSWMNTKRVISPLSLGKYLASWFPTRGIPDSGDEAGYLKRTGAARK